MAELNEDIVDPSEPIPPISMDGPIDAPIADPTPGPIEVPIAVPIPVPIAASTLMLGVIYHKILEIAGQNEDTESKQEDR